MPPKIKLTPLPSSTPNPSSTTTSTSTPPHHIGNPPHHFQNPWPSYKPIGLLDAFSCKLGIGHKKNFVPVPENREGLVKIISPPAWGHNISGQETSLKATWLGHASWFIETGPGAGMRSVRILLDPVFAERTSPFTFVGPKRYSPTPCSIDELPEVDVVCISHLHYDHADAEALVALAERSKETVFLTALGGKRWVESLGISEERCVECDWWDGFEVSLSSEENGEREGEGKVELRCTPAQHASARTPFDRDRALWCSWTLLEYLDEHADGQAEAETEGEKGRGQRRRTLFFAGDTGYRSVTVPHPTREQEAEAPVCPAFKQIGDLYGPVDLALLPIGLCTPRDFMSSVHCSPEDSICVHRDLKSKKSIGMHYGTVRGGISAQYEDVLEPPRRWRELVEEREGKEWGLQWGVDCGLCDIGETVVVS